MPKLIIFTRHQIDHLLEDKRTIEECVGAFQEWMVDAIGELAAETPSVERCVVSQTLLSGYRKGSPRYDSLAELWFADEGDARELLRSEPYRALPSHPLVDSGAFGSILTTDHVAKDGPIPDRGVKSFEFVTRKPGIPLVEFGSYWRKVHGPLAARIPMIRRYVQSHCVPSEYHDGAQPMWDGVAITWFDDTSEMRRSAETPELAETRDDEPNFLAPGHLPFIITTEVAVPVPGEASVRELAPADREASGRNG